jgi:hypothetical protein
MNDFFFEEENVSILYLNKFKIFFAAMQFNFPYKVFRKTVIYQKYYSAGDFFRMKEQTIEHVININKTMIRFHEMSIRKNC